MDLFHFHLLGGQELNWFADKAGLQCQLFKERLNKFNNFLSKLYFLLHSEVLKAVSKTKKIFDDVQLIQSFKGMDFEKSWNENGEGLLSSE